MLYLKNGAQPTLLQYSKRLQIQTRQLLTNQPFDTSVIGKVLESIIRNHATDHLDQHNLIVDTQHGFRKRKFCTTNLLDHLEALTKQVDEGVSLDVVYWDLAKAFDTVPHRRLLAKIRAHGIDGRVARWIEAWLADRKHRVITQGATSNWEQVTSSVVQGSVLGPLCFLIYMKDMENDISPSSKVSKFADDTTPNYPTQWQMRCNVGKCGVTYTGYYNPTQTYTVGNTPLKETEEEKDLGIWICKSLKTSTQCAATVKKANRFLGMIERNFAYKAELSS